PRPTHRTPALPLHVIPVGHGHLGQFLVHRRVDDRAETAAALHLLPVDNHQIALPHISTQSHSSLRATVPATGVSACSGKHRSLPFDLHWQTANGTVAART